MTSWGWVCPRGCLGNYYYGSEEAAREAKLDHIYEAHRRLYDDEYAPKDKEEA